MSTTTTDTYDQVGIREDLSDIIANISPEEVPFYSNCAKEDITNTLFEWQTDSLADVSVDTAIEGEDATFAPSAPTTRLNNISEIIEKTAAVSGTVEATDRAGREREMGYQILKRAKEIRRDAEHHLVGISQEKIAGSDTVARKTASVQTWMATNTSRDAGGADPAGDGSDTPTDGTQRPFTESLLGEVIDSIYVEGGNPDVLMANAFNKRAITGFSGNADEVKHDNVDQTVINAVSVYVSDYNTISVVPNRFLRPRDVLVLEMDYWAVGVLRPMQNMEIARTGDAEKRQVLMEFGLCAKQEASSGIVADLTTA